MGGKYFLTFRREQYAWWAEFKKFNKIGSYIQPPSNVVISIIMKGVKKTFKRSWKKKNCVIDTFIVEKIVIKSMMPEEMQPSMTGKKTAGK